MRRFGISMMTLGVLSVPLKLVGMQFFVLLWIDTFGDLAGWFLRAGVIGLGYYLYKWGDGDSSTAV